MRASEFGAALTNWYSSAPPVPAVELADASAGVGAAVGHLSREPLVEVIVAVEDHVDPGGLEQRPHVAHERVRTVRSRAEQRMVPHRQRARRPLRFNSARTNSHCAELRPAGMFELSIRISQSPAMNE